MSIINEALKKVEQKRDESAENSFAIKIGSVRPKQWTVRSIVIGACMLVLVFVLLLIILPTHKKSSLKYSQLVASVAPPASEAATQVSLPQEAPSGRRESQSFFGKIFDPNGNQSNFRLSGIMLSEEGPLAIINNEILKQGDSIGGATINSIGQNEVKLSYQGEELILKVK